MSASSDKSFTDLLAKQLAATDERLCSLLSENDGLPKQIKKLRKRKAKAIEKVLDGFWVEESAIKNRATKFKADLSQTKMQSRVMQLLSRLFHGGHPVIVSASFYEDGEFADHLGDHLSEELLIDSTLESMVDFKEHVIKHTGAGHARGYKAQDSVIEFDEDDTWLESESWYSPGMVLNPLEDWNANWRSAFEDAEIDDYDFKECRVYGTAKLRVYVMTLKSKPSEETAATTETTTDDTKPATPTPSAATTTTTTTTQEEKQA